ncbi:hypothetical protein B0J17DRAFT_715825 [Rhizoctonia solani]|nr:hypothetical protein B0J17DRAFT_715825 [Rhizoctonia solani]
MSHSSTYNKVSIIIAAVILTVGLALFYLFYWRKRPTNPEPQLWVSRAGVAHFVTGDVSARRERQGIIEQARREREEHDRCAAESGARRAEDRSRDGVNLPKYSRVSESTHSSNPEMEGVAGHVTIQFPPPTYDQTVARPPSPHRTRA